MKQSLKLSDLPFSTLCLLLFLLINGCDLFKKTDPRPLTELEKLPPATQTGKNTFGCLVNGKAWVPQTTTDFQADYQTFLQIGASLNLGGAMKISANRPILTNSSFDLTNNQICGANFSTSLCSYKYSDTYYGKLLITRMDTVSYIISGTFEFKTASTGCDTLKITNGRFDIKYIP